MLPTQKRVIQTDGQVPLLVGVKSITNKISSHFVRPSQLIPESVCEKHHTLPATNALCHPGLALPAAMTHCLAPEFYSSGGGPQNY